MSIAVVVSASKAGPTSTAGSRSALWSRRRVVLSLRRRPRKARGKFSLESVTFGFVVSFVIQFLLVRGVQIH